MFNALQRFPHHTIHIEGVAARMHLKAYDYFQTAETELIVDQIGPSRKARDICGQAGAIIA